MKTPIPILLGLILLLSCTDTQKSAVFITTDLSDYIVDTLYLEKDTLTRSLPREFTFLEQEGRSYLYGIVGLRLYQYDYQSGELVGSVNFEREGPDGIGSFISGILITADGIFFISDQKELVHSDFNGKVLYRFPLPEVPEERLAVNFSAVNGNKMNYDKGKKELIFADVPYVLKEPLMDYENWVWKYDLTKRSAESMPFAYPDIYREHYDDNELGIYSHFFLNSEQLQVVSFPVTDALLVIDGEGSKWVPSQSTVPLIFQKGVTEQRGEYIVFSPSMETSRYKWVFFEPNSQLLLRYVDIETKIMDNGSVHNKSSFILHGLDFETVGELFFNNRQIASNGFSSPKGYYFKLLNPASDDVEEYVRVRLANAITK